MPLLKHQLILHPDIVGQFALDKPVTTYDRQVGFSWYLCPVIVADKSEWLLVNVEFGYCQLVIAPEKTPLHIGDAAIRAIEDHLPEDRDEDNVSVSLSTDDVSWRTATQMPEHVGLRYQEAHKILRKCADIHDADDALEKLNETPLKLHGRTFTPTEGLAGLLLELADNFRHYVETTPWWKLQWHVWTKKVPWLAQGQIKNKESPTT